MADSLGSEPRENPPQDHASLEQRIGRWIPDTGLTVLVLVFAFLCEFAVKAQNQALGYLATDDEWTVYLRGLFLLQHGSFPAFEPLQIPHNPIVAAVGTTVVYAALIGALGTNPLALSYVGAAIGGLVFPMLYLVARWVFADREYRNLLAAAAVGLAVLSSPLLVRMQLLLGETIAFPLFLLAMGLFVKERYRPIPILLLLIGFTEEFTLFISVFIIGLIGLFYLVVRRDLRRFAWSFLICAVGASSELVLLFAQGPSSRLNQASGGIFPYPHLFNNFELAIGFLGVVLPVLGTVGYLWYLRDSLKTRLSHSSLTLIVWFSVCFLYVLLPPFLPGGSQFRTFDYVTLPGAIMGSYVLMKLASRESRRPLLITSSLIFGLIAFEIVLSMLYFPFSFIPTFGGLFDTIGSDVLVLLAGGAACGGMFLLIRRASASGVGRRRILSISVLLLFTASILTTAYYAPFEKSDYASYFTSNETDYITGLSSSLPQNAIIAANYIIGPAVAGLTDRTVKNLPSYLGSPSEILGDIANSSIYSEQYGAVGGVVPAPLRVPIAPGQPVYLLVVVGSYVSVSTTPAILHELEQDSRFSLAGSSGNVYLFSVSLPG